MQTLSEKNFAFLEQSPYFYEKRDPFIAKTGGVRTEIVYTFYSQESPYQVLAEILIPTDMSKEVKWKFYHFVENDRQFTPIYQATNPKVEVMPLWFKSLLRKATEMYRKISSLLNLFNPELKNNPRF